MHIGIEDGDQRDIFWTNGQAHNMHMYAASFGCSHNPLESVCVLASPRRRHSPTGHSLMLMQQS
jgi:hypothetical protein